MMFYGVIFHLECRDTETACVCIGY